MTKAPQAVIDGGNGKTLEKFVLGLREGRPVSFENLTIVPLFGDEAGPTVVLLGLALGSKLAEVGEIGEHGEVPRLRVTNHGKCPVLILDGEELVGAKQNRIVNTTILVAGGTTIDIPVSCVEHGRWAWRSKTFAASGRMLTATLRAKKSERVSKSVTMSGCYDADQRAVWDDVAEYAARRKVNTMTGAFADVYASDEKDIESYVAALQPQPGQLGLAGYIGKRLVSIDVTGRAEAYGALHDKLVGGLAAAAIDSRGERELARRRSLGPVLRAATKAERVSSKPPGLGTDLRLEWPGFHGAALLANEGVVHLSLFGVES